MGLSALLFLQVRLRLSRIVDRIDYKEGIFTIWQNSQEERIPINEVARIDDNTFCRPESITLFLKTSSRFGTKITFYPSQTFNPFEKHPLATALVSILEETKPKNS